MYFTGGSTRRKPGKYYVAVTNHFIVKINLKHNE